jgi:Trypsin-like peptidase domain
MREFMRGAFVAGAASAMLFAGAGELSPELPDSPATVQTVDIPGASPHEVTIDLGYRPLPSDIGSVMLSTVKVSAYTSEVVYEDPTKKVIGAWYLYEQGSGTIVDHDGSRSIVTAAHVVVPANGHCADEKITLSDPYSAKGYAMTQVAEQDPVTGVSPYDPTTYNGGFDAAVISPSYNRDLQRTDAMDVQAHVSLEPGDTLFSLGYGPRTDRSPDPASQDPTAQHPMIVPGEVLSVQGNLVYFVAGVGQNYDRKDTSTVHHGDSGGTVIDAHGRYVGDVIAARGEGLSQSAKQIEQDFHVQFPKIAQNEKFAVDIAEIVDAKSLEQAETNFRSCTSGLPERVVEVPAGTNPSTLPRKQDMTN